MRNLNSQGYIPHPTLQPQVEKDGKENPLAEGRTSHPSPLSYFESWSLVWFKLMFRLVKLLLSLATTCKCNMGSKKLEHHKILPISLHLASLMSWSQPSFSFPPSLPAKRNKTKQNKKNPLILVWKKSHHRCCHFSFSFLLHVSFLLMFLLILVLTPHFLQLLVL